MRLTAPPIDITRDEAARAAREELSKGIYHRDDPSLLSQLFSWVGERVADLLSLLALRSPGGWWGIAALVVLVVVAAVVVRWRIGAMARTARRPTAGVFGGRVRTAAEHRAAADAAAERGDHGLACRERFRAVVRELEERAVLDVRPGRTATEVARETAVFLPHAAAALEVAARTFDEVCYGGRRATTADDAVIRAADDAVRTPGRRPTVAAAR